MQHETELGGEVRDFPWTRRSLVARIGAAEPSERRAAQGELIAIYWKPVYAYLRLRWRHDNERAKDVTQSFFVGVIEKGWLADFDPARARFRSYLRTCLDRFVANDDRARAAERRGGNIEHVALDFDAAESELGNREPPDPNTLDEWFEAEWRRSLLAVSLAELESKCAERGLQTRFEIFRRYDIEPSSPSEKPTYEQLARELDLPTHAITNALSIARREFRLLVVLRVMITTGNEDEYQAELRSLFGTGDVGA